MLPKRAAWSWALMGTAGLAYGPRPNCACTVSWLLSQLSTSSDGSPRRCNHVLMVYLFSGWDRDQRRAVPPGTRPVRYTTIYHYMLFCPHPCCNQLAHPTPYRVCHTVSPHTRRGGPGGG